MMAHMTWRPPIMRGSLPIALAVTMLSTVCAAAFPAGGSSADSPNVESIQYRADNPRCDTFYGAFPCSSADWGRCYDDYRSIFPCSSPGAGRHRR